MGCDIHVFVEYKYKGQKWQLLKNPAAKEDRDHQIDCISARDYEFFGILAGVRNTFKKPIAADRGVPKAVSPDLARIIEENLVDNYWHSPTYCSFKEMEKAFRRYYMDLINDRAELIFNVESLLKEFDPKVKSDAIFENGIRYSNMFDYLTLIPIRTFYDTLCGEALLLGDSKPRLRFFIAFDS